MVQWRCYYLLIKCHLESMYCTLFIFNNPWNYMGVYSCLTSYGTLTKRSRIFFYWRVVLCFDHLEFCVLFYLVQKMNRKCRVNERKKTYFASTACRLKLKRLWSLPNDYHYSLHLNIIIRGSNARNHQHHMWQYHPLLESTRIVHFKIIYHCIWNNWEQFHLRVVWAVL